MRRRFTRISTVLVAAAAATLFSAPAKPTITTKSPEATGAATDTAVAKSLIESGPAYGWTYPVYTDKEGYHVYTLRGDEGRYINANEIDVTGFSAVVFSGDANERVDTVLMSPQASFYPKDNRATGSDAVRLILSGRPDTPNDDVEVTGRGWTYDHASKKVSIAHDVRVTFHAQLHDILK